MSNQQSPFVRIYLVFVAMLPGYCCSCMGVSFSYNIAFMFSMTVYRITVSVGAPTSNVIVGEAGSPTVSRSLTLGVAFDNRCVSEDEASLFASSVASSCSDATNML